MKRITVLSMILIVVALTTTSAMAKGSLARQVLRNQPALQQIVTPALVDDQIQGQAELVDDKGGQGEVEPGDDKGGQGEVEPGDDKGGQGEVELGDDKGG